MKRKLLIILLFTPLYVFFMIHGLKKLRREVCEWMKVIHLPYSGSTYLNALDLMSRLPEFRFILYYRYKIDEFNPIRLIYPAQMMSMSCEDVGEGLVIQHGFGSRLGASKIGKHCQIWQGVTIGKVRSGVNEAKPIIGDNVKIFAGSFVLGGISIGDNVTIGAATVVLESVPSGCTVVGNPARIIKRG